MPPNSALEWIAGANVPRKGRSRPRRRIIAEYETEDEDDEIEFFVKSKKRPRPAAADPPPATAEPAASPEPEPEDKAKSETTAKKSKKDAKVLKSAMKKPPPPPAESSADSSDAAELSSDKEVETSGTESGSSPEDHLKEFDPECPCTNCVRAHRALKRSRLGRTKVKKRVSFSDDEEEETDASDDAETVHNFFKWNQAMEAKKARDQEAKDYKEFLADKAKKAEYAKKAAEKKELEARKKEEDAKRKEDEKSKKAEEEKKKKKEKGDDGENKKQKNKKEGDEKKSEEKPKDKQDKAKDKKKAVSSGETTEASASEAETSKDETGAETSGDESAKESGSKKKSKAKDKSPSASEASDSGKGEESTMIAMLMEKLLKAKEKKKREKGKQREKARKAETRKESREKPSGHPATSFNPNWLMPPQSDVVHVEHSMETPHDPRPNAFFDNRNRVMRVYHGPNYGNPTGGLYQNPNIRSSSSPQVPAQQGRPVVHPDYSMYDDNGQYVGNMQPPVQGYPPQQPQQTAAARSSPNVNQWFQGNGTTTVPSGNGDNGEVQRPRHAPEFTYDPRIFADAEKDAYYRSPQVQDSRPRTQNNAQHPPPDSGYHTRGAQGARVAANGQSPSGAKASPNSLEAQMKKDLEDLRTRLARTSSSMKSGTSHHNNSPVQNSHGNNGASNQPPSRRRNSPNVAQQGNAPSSSSWDAQPSSNAQPSSQQPTWTSPQQNAHSSPAWEDNNASNSRAPNTSDSWNDSGNTNGVAQDTSSNWDNNVHSNTQNNNDWSNETTSNNNGYNNNGNNDFNNVQWSPRPASNGDNTSMPPTTTAPGGWPTSPTNQQGFSSNSGGDHWASNADQGWGDKLAAQSSGGYWENEGKDDGKAPDPAVAW